MAACAAHGHAVGTRLTVLGCAQCRAGVLLGPGGGSHGEGLPGARGARVLHVGAPGAAHAAHLLGGRHHQVVDVARLAVAGWASLSEPPGTPMPRVLVRGRWRSRAGPRVGHDRGQLLVGQQACSSAEPCAWLLLCAVLCCAAARGAECGAVQGIAVPGCSPVCHILLVAMCKAGQTAGWMGGALGDRSSSKCCCTATRAAKSIGCAHGGWEFAL
jgi:hypothetical protein